MQSKMVPSLLALCFYHFSLFFLSLVGRILSVESWSDLSLSLEQGLLRRMLSARGFPVHVHLFLSPGWVFLHSPGER